MPEPEVRYPCPVCLGVKLSKIRIVSTENLILDRCERCGGIWFDEGEVARLRTFRLEGVRQKVRPSDSAFRMSCHSCQALMDRNAEECIACGWDNVLDCPVCSRPMKRRAAQGWHLDFCTVCRGAWFDQIELAEIWNLHAEAPGERRAISSRPTAGAVAEVCADVAEILFWSPDLVVWGAEAAGSGVHAVASGVAHVAGEAPQILGSAVEATGDLAGSVFETIADVVGSLFS